MKLRTHLTTLLVLLTVLGATALTATLMAARAIDAATLAENRARATLREARGLIVNTHEFVLYGHERAAQQWQRRYATLKTLVQPAAAGARPTVALAPNLSQEIDSLPDLFDGLVATGRAPAGDEVAQRRRELLVDSLIADTQSILEQVMRWETALGSERTASEHQLALLAATQPVLMLIVIALIAWVVAHRVLGPLKQLQAAMAAVERGDLSVRRGSRSADEVGDLARGFDRMTASLESSVVALADNEHRLRTITDNLPARIAYIDADQTYRFANAACISAVGARSAEALIGRHLRDVRGEASYAEIQPHVTAALGGERRAFLHRETERGQLRHNEYVLVPDRPPGGDVRGYYAMVNDVTEHLRAQARVEAALHEKEVLLKEVHHRVKNNMQVISSLLQLQTGYVENSEAQRLLADSQDRIKSMALIHEKLYQSNDFAQVDFADYIHSLATMLAASHVEAAQARVEVVAEPIWINIDQAIPAGLVLNELVSNSYKHAFPPGRDGTIRISFRAADPGRVALTIADDGVGPPPGFDARSGTTLGLRLVHILADQLDAELTIRHERGFSCELTFAPPPRRAAAAAASGPPANAPAFDHAAA